MHNIYCVPVDMIYSPAFVYCVCTKYAQVNFIIEW